MTRAPRAGAAAPALALAVGLVLADSSVVTLALPEILRELDATVGGVAWVLIAFNLALALAALPAARVTRGRAREGFVAGLIVFAGASAACALAPSLGVLIAARALQGVAGAVAVAGALELLVAELGRERAVGRWGAAGIIGAAVGPAAGGLLTEAFSWEAMFALQAPVALVALLGARGARPPRDHALPAGRPALAPLAALTLLSAALAAALFLLVLMVIEGWRVSPGKAALAVSIMPVAALVAGRLARGHERPAVAAAGIVLVAGGLAGLGLLPGAGAGWTVAPQVALGAGLGLALAALIAGTVGGAADPARPAAWTITARHVGIVVGLLLLTPVFTADLQDARGPAERAGVARLLDSPLPLSDKIALARALAERVRSADDRLPDLGPAFAAQRGSPADRAARERLRSGLDDELDRAGTQAFERSFRLAAVLALLALVPLGLAARGARPRPVGAPGSNGSHLARGAPLAVALPAAVALATLLLAAQVALGGTDYGPSATANPCAARERAAPERLGRPQRIALAVLDGAACELDTSREAVLLALLRKEQPAGADSARLTDALRTGVSRAREEGALNVLQATALRAAVSVGGADLVLRLLLRR